MTTPTHERPKEATTTATSAAAPSTVGETRDDGRGQLRASLRGADLATQLSMLAPGGGEAGGAPPVQLKAESERRTAGGQQARAQNRAEAREGTLTPETDGRSGEEKLVATGASSMAENPNFEKDASAFERALGRDAYAKGLPAAEQLCAKAKAYIEAKVGPWREDNGALATELAKIGSSATDTGWTGAVGQQVDALMAVFDSGNLRMRMWHVGNFFWKLLGDDLLDKEVSEMRSWVSDAGMRLGQIRARKAQMQSSGWDIVTTPADSEVSGQGSWRRSGPASPPARRGLRRWRPARRGSG